MEINILIEYVKAVTQYQHSTNSIYAKQLKKRIVCLRELINQYIGE